MPAWALTILGVLFTWASSVVGYVMLSMGLSLVVYSGASALLDWIGAEVKARLQGAPAMAVDVLTTLQLDTCISILLSAYAIKLTMAGLDSVGRRAVHLRTS